MRIVESKPGHWFLLTDRGKLYIEIRFECNDQRIFILMELNKDEYTAYMNLGRTYLILLVQRVSRAHTIYLPRNMLVSTEESAIDTSQERKWKRPRTRSFKLKDLLHVSNSEKTHACH